MGLSVKIMYISQQKTFHSSGGIVNCLTFARVAIETIEELLAKKLHLLRRKEQANEKGETNLKLVV